MSSLLRVDSTVATNDRIILTEYRRGRQARAHSAESVPQLHREAFNGRFVSAAGPWGPRRALVGREGDLDEPRVVLEEAVSGRGSLVLSAGEPRIWPVTPSRSEFGCFGATAGRAVVRQPTGNRFRSSASCSASMQGTRTRDGSRVRCARAADVARIVPEFAEGFLDRSQFDGNALMCSFPHFS